MYVIIVGADSIHVRSSHESSYPQFAAHASSVRLALSSCLFTVDRRVIRSFYYVPISLWYFDSRSAVDSEDDPIRVAGVVVVGVAVVVHVPEVGRAVRRTEPPVVRGADL